jgi:hypothetical protein
VHFCGHESSASQGRFQCFPSLPNRRVFFLRSHTPNAAGANKRKPVQVGAALMQLLSSSCWTASRHINRLGWNFMLLSRNCKEPTVQIDHQGSSGLLFDGQIQYAPSTRGTACFVHEREIMPIKKQLLSK